MQVRRALPGDFSRIMEIYRQAQDYMIRAGNPTQWGHAYPDEALVRRDIEQGACRLVCDGEAIRGVFALFAGEDPGYRVIEDGAWLNGAPYLTIHRIASDGSGCGVFRCAVDWCKGLSDNLRIDTHRDNLPMQRHIARAGFRRCGIIYTDDGTPRIAYHWVKGPEVDHTGEAEYMELIIRRDAPVVPHKRHWQFCVGSGHAVLALRADYARQLRFIHDTLGIRRVRFHGILDDDMRTFTDLSMMMNAEGAREYAEYNFNACGVAYDNVLAAGMKPFVELSFMPGKLAKREPDRPLEGFFFYRPKVVPPADEAAWTDYIQAFVRFLIHRYGADEVRSWCFEVWNEPDLPGAFFNGTRDEYFRLYEITARAIKAVDAAIPVGGPATSNSRWVRSFLDFCAANAVPVDFVSTHQYAGDPLGGVEDQGDEPRSQGWEDTPERRAAQRAALAAAGENSFLAGLRALMPDKSETEDISRDVFSSNARVARRQAGDMPLYYTEWNENAIFSAFTNDTRKVAAYDVRMALEVADDVDGSSIWCFSDIFEELHPFPQEFHGGFGMLTQNGIPKPVYHAMRMLAEAGDQRLDLGPDATRGEIGFAAFRAGERTQVLLFRQKMKNTPLPPEPVRVAVELDRAPSRVTVRRIDEEHGNPLRLWQAMGSPASLNRAEVDAIREGSAVFDEPWPFEYRDGCARLEARLGVNDIWLINLWP